MVRLVQCHLMLLGMTHEWTLLTFDRQTLIISISMLSVFTCIVLILSTLARLTFNYGTHMYLCVQAEKAFYINILKLDTHILND